MALRILLVLLLLCPLNAIGAGFTDAPGGELTSSNITSSTILPAQKSSTGHYVEVGDLRSKMFLDDTLTELTNTKYTATPIPRVFGFVDGTSASPLEVNSPSIWVQRFDASTQAASGSADGTYSAVFETFTSGGNTVQSFSLVGWNHGLSTNTKDVVGVAGIATSEGENWSWALFGDCYKWHPNGRIAGIEVDVYNGSGTALDSANSMGAGASIGAWVVGYAAYDGYYNTVGLLIDAVDSGSNYGKFYRGISFTSDSIAPNYYGIDFTELPSTVTPILLNNGAYVKSENYAGTGTLSLFKTNTANELEIGPITVRTNTAAVPFVFRESDATLPAGLWRVVVDSNAWRIDINTHADGTFGTYITPFGIGDDGRMSFGVPWALGSDERLEIEQTKTITSSPADGYSAAIRIDPGYTAASALTVTRHNYIDLQDVSVAGDGPAAVTDAAVFRFDANIGTHKAVRASGSVDSYTWDGFLKINVNGTLYYIPFCAAGDIS